MSLWRNIKSKVEHFVVRENGDVATSVQYPITEEDNKDKTTSSSSNRNPLIQSVENVSDTASDSSFLSSESSSASSSTLSSGTSSDNTSNHRLRKSLSGTELESVIGLTSPQSKGSKDPSKIVSIAEEAYIPLEYAREKIKKMLLDWTKLKQEYLLALKETDERYKQTERDHLDQVEQLEKSMKKSKKEIEKLSGIISHLKSDIYEVNKQLEDRYNELQDSKLSVLQEKQKYESVHLQLTELQESMVMNLQQLNNYEKQFEEYEQRKRESEEQVAKLTEDIKILRELETRRKETEDLVTRLTVELEEKKKVIDELSEQIITKSSSTQELAAASEFQAMEPVLRVNEQQHEETEKKLADALSQLTKRNEEFKKKELEAEVSSSQILRLQEELAEVSQKIASMKGKQLTSNGGTLFGEKETFAFVKQEKEEGNFIHQQTPILSDSKQLIDSFQVISPVPQKEEDVMKKLRENVIRLEKEVMEKSTELEQLHQNAEERISLFQQKLMHLETDLASYREKRTESENGKELHSSEVEKLSQKLSEYQSKVKLQTEQISKMAKKIEEYRLKLGESRQEIAAIQKKGSEPTEQETLLQIENGMMKQKLSDYNDVLAIKTNLEDQINELTKSIMELKRDKKSHSDMMEAIKNKYSKKLEMVEHKYQEKLKSQTVVYQKQLQEAQQSSTNSANEATSKIKELELKNSYLDGKLHSVNQTVEQLTDSVNKKTEENDDLLRRVSSLEKTTYEIESMRQTIEEAKEQLNKERQRFSDLEREFKESESMRRKLHNEKEDSKGKIRVYARCRPLSKSERANDNKISVGIVDESTIRVIPKKKDFVFSQVFGDDSTQEEVFKHTSDLIQSALDGYNVCIFAYGQTGSGKTFTIAGGDTPESEGVVPRSIRHMFKLFEKNKKMYSYEVECYMLELYLDDLYDLFGPKQKGDLKIKKDNSGNVVVVGVTKKRATTWKELYEIYNSGGLNRHTRQTKMNEASSRSHLVFSILISGKNLNTGEESLGKLTLVDLAGSESRKKTQTDEMGNKEALSINGSLLCLGDVISALSEKKKYVPYRNSPLTMLLSDSLGGVAKTLMFVCVSPADYNVDETVTSLTYAARVRTIQNSIKAQVDTVEIARLKKIIEKLKSAQKSGQTADVTEDEFAEISDSPLEESTRATEVVGTEESPELATDDVPTPNSKEKSKLAPRPNKAKKKK